MAYGDGLPRSVDEMRDTVDDLIAKVRVLNSEGNHVQASGFAADLCDEVESLLATLDALS